MLALVDVTIDNHYFAEKVEAVSRSRRTLEMFDREYKLVPIISEEESSAIIK